MSITGVSIGGGNIEVTELKWSLCIAENEYTNFNYCSPRHSWNIAKVTDILSEHNINIAQMNVTRERAGEKAIMIIEVDSRDCHKAVEQIQQIPHLHNVNFFD